MVRRAAVNEAGRGLEMETALRGFGREPRKLMLQMSEWVKGVLMHE
jgi:hypothetical protein